MENNLKYWENRFKFMIEEKAKNSYIYLGSNDEFQIKNRPNEVLNPCNLNYIINQISLLNGITKDNIHLYYEFMSNEDKIKVSHTLLNLLFKARALEINKVLNTLYSSELSDLKVINITYYKTNKTSKPAIYDNGKCLDWGGNFGIKDTLNPINEYIKQIKQSEQYQQYIKNKD